MKHAFDVRQFGADGALLACIFVACFIAILAAPALGAEANRSRYAKVHPVPAADVRWIEGFWAERFALCRNAILPAVEAALRDPRNGAQLANFRVAAGLDKGKHAGCDWSDGDCYKWLEGLASVYAVTGERQLDQTMDEWIETIARCQAKDGYLSTNIQLTDKGRYSKINHHELYNMGHLLTAASVHRRATGKDNFLRIARGVADHLYTVFQPRRAELRRFDFNPSHIMGLVDLYRLTGERRYLELAGIFIDNRGDRPADEEEVRKYRGPENGLGGTDLTQDRVPLRQETQAVGHAVCGTYLWSGAADVCAETGEKTLRGALERVWLSACTRRMYLTGGVGSSREGKSPRGDAVHEAFSGDYDLPDRAAYNETCASFGNAMWNQRMLALSGDARYADIVEQVLYNSGLSGVGVEGRDFFYANPLRRDGSKDSSAFHAATRWRTHGCFCCPPQVARILASLHGWAYGVSDGAVWVHLYGGSRLNTRLPDGGAIRLVQTTKYPWEGQIKIALDEAPAKETAVMLRIPGWAEKAVVRVNGREAGEVAAGTYFPLRRAWKAGDVIDLDLPMTPRWMQAHPAIESARGRAAAMRGPLVYCLECPVKGDGAQVWKRGVYLPEGATLTPHWRADLLGGVMVLRSTTLTAEGRDRLAADPAATRPAPVVDWGQRLYRPLPMRPGALPAMGTVDVELIPYFAWANRGESLMEVWIPLAK